jgi:hypothetical protein
LNYTQLKDDDNDACIFKNVLDIFPPKILQKILEAEEAGDMTAVRRLILRSKTNKKVPDLNDLKAAYGRMCPQRMCPQLEQHVAQN